MAEALKGTGAVFKFLPPYSPHLKPVKPYIRELRARLDAMPRLQSADELHLAIDLAFRPDSHEGFRRVLPLDALQCESG